jgi:hypothetical protein
MTVRTEVTDLDNMILQVGEVQAYPSQYTVLDRLKTLDNDIKIGNSKCIMTYDDFIRPSDTIAYNINDILNINNATQLRPLYFDTQYANRNLETFTQSIICEDNAYPLFYMHYFTAPTIGSLSLADNSLFTPAYADLVPIYLGGTVISTGYNFSNAVYENAGTQKMITLNANATLWYCLTFTSAYTPKSAEHFRVLVSAVVI